MFFCFFYFFFGPRWIVYGRGVLPNLICNSDTYGIEYIDVEVVVVLDLFEVLLSLCVRIVRCLAISSISCWEGSWLNAGWSPSGPVAVDIRTGAGSGEVPREVFSGEVVQVPLDLRLGGGLCMCLSPERTVLGLFRSA